MTLAVILPRLDTLGYQRQFDTACRRRLAHRQHQGVHLAGIVGVGLRPRIALRDAADGYRQQGLACP